MKVKNGIASSVSLLITPYTRSGSACRKSGWNWCVISMPISANMSPLAASENATG